MDRILLYVVESSDERLTNLEESLEYSMIFSKKTFPIVFGVTEFFRG